jgi:hypothetical protein
MSEDRKGISEFLTDILRQLNASAWLPAVMLVCNIAVVYEMSSRHSADLGAAVSALIDSGWALVGGLLISLLVAAMITQAFAFEAIRVLQGDWPDSPVTAVIRDVFSWRQERAVRRAESREAKLTAKAFRSVKYALLEQPAIPREHIAILEESLVNPACTDVRRQHTQDRIDEAQAIDWKRDAPLKLIRRLDAVQASRADYPATPRELRPTRLGNVLRGYRKKAAASDPLAAVSQGYVLRYLNAWPAPLLEAHNEQRTKLDMYCTSVFVFAALAVASPALLATTVGPRPALVAAGVYAVLARVAYLAAVATSRAYGAVLVAMAEGRRSG